MNNSAPIECKHFNPEDCQHFKTYCVLNKRGKCQRNRDGLDLPKEKVIAYLEDKKSKNIVIHQTHFKKNGIKLSGVRSGMNEFESVIMLSNHNKDGIEYNNIKLRFLIEGYEVAKCDGYIKKMVDENLLIDVPLYDYSGNSRYNTIKSTDRELMVLEINWVYTDPIYMGNRFGMYAIYLVEQIAKEHFDIKYITLDDHTSVDPPDNIYYKLNFNLLTWGSNNSGSYQMWKDWHKWLETHDMNSVNNDERMISIEQFESADEIVSIQKQFQIEK